MSHGDVCYTQLYGEKETFVQLKLIAHLHPIATTLRCSNTFKRLEVFTLSAALLERAIQRALIVKFYKNFHLL